MEHRWQHKILLVEDEAGLFPAMAQNMLLFRSMKSRENFHELNPFNYGAQEHLFGHMPIVIIAGDFLQIKPANDISVADDFEALRAAGENIHPEHTIAQNAILNIHDVIHLKISKRFLDDAMTPLMKALRASRPDAPLPLTHLAALRCRKIEVCQKELETPLFADGHIVAMYLENVARSMSERAHRDAVKIECSALLFTSCRSKSRFPKEGSPGPRHA